MLKPLDFMEPIQGIEVEEDLYSWEDQSRLTIVVDSINETISMKHIKPLV